MELEFAVVKDQSQRPITIKDKLVMGKTYTVFESRATLIGIYDYFARFRFEDGHIESFLYSDLERWKYNPNGSPEL